MVTATNTAADTVATAVPTAAALTTTVANTSIGVNPVPGVEVGNLSHPAGADTVGSVHQDHGDDGHVPLRLYPDIVVHQVVQQRLVVLVEDVTKKKTEKC